MTALELAIKLRDGGPTLRDCGICSNLREQAYKEFKAFLYESDYDNVYPVEVDLMGMDDDAADEYYRDCGDKWVGAHGALRMKLLNDFINWLEPKK